MTPALSRFVMRQLGLGALIDHDPDPMLEQVVPKPAPDKPTESFEDWQQEAARLIAGKQARGG